MRILRTIRSVNPEGGGPIEGIIQVSRALNELGHRVEMLSLDTPEDSWVRNSSLKIHARGRGGRNYGYAPEFVRWLRRHQDDYDAIIVSGLWQFHSYGVWQALRGARVPYFVFPHGMLDPWFKRAHPLKHLKKWLYWPWAEYRVLRDARAVLFTCDEERRLARESFWLYRCNERVVNYGTAAPPADRWWQKATFLEQFPELRSRRVVLFLGRLHAKKGCDVLLRAFHVFESEQREQGDDSWHLVLAGPDQDGWQRQLEALAARLKLIGRVTFTGMLRGELKWGAFRQAELFVLPSHQENFGIAVVEALACGVPVVVSTSVNIWREIVQDRAGWACAADAEEVCRALRQWATMNTNERECFCHRAQGCFAGRFEIEQAALSLLAALQ